MLLGKLNALGWRVSPKRVAKYIIASAVMLYMRITSRHFGESWCERRFRGGDLNLQKTAWNVCCGGKRAFKDD